MRVVSTSIWDNYFFERFVAFRNLLHRNIVTSFPEKTDDYKKYFDHGSHFENDYSWEGYMVVSNDDQVVAKAILAWRKKGATGNLGFIDWENNPEAAQLLIDAISATARRHRLKRIKSPVDLNLFVKYRIRLPGGDKPFWGEPVYPDYYHELFLHTGFKEIARWDTFRINKLQGILDYALKRLQLAKKTEGSHSRSKSRELRTTIRCVDLKNWDNEIRIIHKLFNEAYQSMAEWEPISFEQFKLIYDDFRYIIHPWYSYIVELRGKPVGFSINFVDPLPVLAKVKGKELSQFQKALLYLKLRTNTSTFLIAHVGKIPGPGGEEIKGVQIQVSKRIQVFSAFMRRVLVTFQVKDSPSRRSFNEKNLKPYAEYVLYGKEL